jgi:DNA helicase HerA-like ATPase
MQNMYREPLLNKLSAFVGDPCLRRILGQTRSTVNFRQAMDQGKWVLLNLSKGQLKENIHLLGTLFLTKMKQAALSRIDTPEHTRRPFFVFIDEVQNFIGGGDLNSLTSELRKFHVGLTMAHQTLDQLPRELRSVILGNVGTEIFFRLSHHDASQISSEMDPKEKYLIEKRLIDLQVGQAYLKVKGQQRPRLLKTLHVPSIHVSDEALERVKQASFRRWATPIAEVEKEIEARRSFWQSTQPDVRSAPVGPKGRSWADQEPLTPEGSFEEGQNDW